MNVNKSRGLIIVLSILAVVSSFAVDNKWVALALMILSTLMAVTILYKHLDDFTNISADNPKMKAVKTVTIFNVTILAICVVFAVLTGTDILKLDTDGRYFAAAIVASVLLFTGNIAPKLPFSKHTGLRLPWTVMDENTWIIAHRILGYVSIPLTFIYIAGTGIIADFRIWTLIIILLWVSIPGGLSYLFFKRNNR